VVFSRCPKPRLSLIRYSLESSSGRKPDQKRGSNKGHGVVNLQYSCVFVGCHLRRKVVEFAASHEAVNRRVYYFSIRSTHQPRKSLVYGQSITDACIGWKEICDLLQELAAAVKSASDYAVASAKSHMLGSSLNRRSKACGKLKQPDNHESARG